MPLIPFSPGTIIYVYTSFLRLHIPCVASINYHIHARIQNEGGTAGIPVRALTMINLSDVLILHSLSSTMCLQSMKMPGLSGCHSSQRFSIAAGSPMFVIIQSASRVFGTSLCSVLSSILGWIYDM
jgi:hypothetical protein